MTRIYNLYQVDSFTKEKFKGNPAGVISNADGLTESEMQKIARELNNSETAFIFSSNNKEYDAHVRFFTPKNEVQFVDMQLLRHIMYELLKMELILRGFITKQGLEFYLLI